MATISAVPATPAVPDEADEVPGADFKPLSAEEARQWREKNPALSPWRIVWVQLAMGALVVLGFWIVTRQARMAWSAGYGVLAVVVPAALFVRGLSRQKAVNGAGAAMFGFFVWEMVKIILTVAMLMAAPKVVSRLSWLALLAGFVVTMKVYWVAMWLRPVRKESIKRI
jgi:ATP synthase protein I